MTDVHARTDLVASGDLRRLAATLDAPAPTTSAPPLWHWTSFLEQAGTATLGPDGHPRAGGLVEHPPYPRRMFAGGRMSWQRDLPLDTPILRRAVVGEAVHKEGRQGPLAFVTVAFTYLVDGQELATEEHDYVYRPDAEPTPPTGGSTPAAAPARPAVLEPADDEPAADWEASATFGPTHLFRFSALTFNAHRIHYDLPYATGVEHHPGLVVHGPLLVIGLLELIRTAHGPDSVASLSFRAVSPAYAGDPIRFLGREGDGVIHLEAKRGRDTLMTADVTLR
jgi:3-methylfumaryl-CoA hydratase